MRNIQTKKRMQCPCIHIPWRQVSQPFENILHNVVLGKTVDVKQSRLYAAKGHFAKIDIIAFCQCYNFFQRFFSRLETFANRIAFLPIGYRLLYGIRHFRFFLFLLGPVGSILILIVHQFIRTWHKLRWMRVIMFIFIACPALILIHHYSYASFLTKLLSIYKPFEKRTRYLTAHHSKQQA
ncbi:hypothetical protein D3C78_660590 [compost metagenome]